MTKVFDKRQIYYYILDCTKSGGIFVVLLIQVCRKTRICNIMCLWKYRLLLIWCSESWNNTRAIWYLENESLGVVFLILNDIRYLGI